MPNTSSHPVVPAWFLSLLLLGTSSLALGQTEPSLEQESKNQPPHLALKDANTGLETPPLLQPAATEAKSSDSGDPQDEEPEKSGRAAAVPGILLFAFALFWFFSNRRQG